MKMSKPVYKPTSPKVNVIDNLLYQNAGSDAKAKLRAKFRQERPDEWAAYDKLENLAEEQDEDEKRKPKKYAGGGIAKRGFGCTRVK